MGQVQRARIGVWCAALFTLLLGPGCVSTSALQTGRTLDKGTSRMHFAAGLYTSPEFDEDVEETLDEDDVDMSLPYLEFALRHGVTENFELGGKFTLPGMLTIDGKYQLIDDGPMAVSAGLGVGYISFKNDLPGGNNTAERCIEDCDGDDPVYEIVEVQKEDITMVDYIVPIYASYHLTDALAFYGSPKYIFRSSEASSHHLGVTSGARLGSDWGLFLEATYMSALSEDFVTIQYASSLFIDF